MSDINTATITDTLDMEPLKETDGRFKSFFKKFVERKTSVFAAIFVLFLFFLMAFGKYIVPYNPDTADYNNIFAGPSAEHWFGTNNFGQDIFSRIVVGTRLSLGVALGSVIVGTFLGTILGILAGFYGGIIDSIVMRCSDVLFAMPDVLLCIAIVAIIGPGTLNVVIAVAVFTVPGFARLMRSATLSIKENLYVEVARSVGCSNFRILTHYIFPNTVQSMIVNFTMRIGGAILAAASLSFLGYGSDISLPEWGAMISTSRTYMSTAPHMVLFPGLMIFLTVLSFNLLGDGLRDTLDPKTK